MEHELIQWLRQHVLQTPCAQNEFKNVLLGIGDDGSVISGSQANQVQVADAIVDQVHFDLNRHELKRVGHKAIAVNLSDIAAMGAIAESALITLVLPRCMSLADAKELFEGIAATAKKYRVAIVGGDTVRHDGPLMVSVAATGRIDPKSNSPTGWRMDNARDGDVLVVSGPLGGSISGRHLSFEPRLELAKAIQSRISIHAATDISDSLSIDLGQLIRSSGVGAILDIEKVPVSAAAIEISKSSGKTPLEHALTDGEDFELLLSMSPTAYEGLLSDASFDFELFPVGQVTGNHPGEIVDAKSGDTVPQSGYEH